MNAQQLRNSILQEAIEGRLVPQDPNDEPASVLLERIREEKKRLVKEGKLKKKDLEEKPISEDEKPFEIPDSWEWVRLANVGTTETGTTPSKSHPEYFGSFIPFLGPANIINGIIVSETQGLSEIGIKYGRVVPADTILQVCIGGSIGKCAISDKPVTFNQQINSVTPIECSVKYVYFVLQSKQFLLSLIDNSTGTATPIINRGNWEQLPFPLPPLAEQKRIVAKIEELLPKVEEYGKAQEALDKLNKELPERLKKSILQEAISGRLVPQDPNDEPASVLLDKIRQEKVQLVKEGKLKKKDLIETPITDDEKPFDIPDSWEWVRFGAITINRDSERIPLSVDERRMLTKTYDYYGASGVIDKVDRYLFDKPLLLIGEDGANLINRSTPIAFIARGKYWVNNHAHVLDYYNEELMQYMCLYINAISLVDYVTGTAQPKMNQEKMNSIMVALPPLAEQKRIVAKIEELFAEIDKLKA